MGKQQGGRHLGAPSVGRDGGGGAARGYIGPGAGRGGTARAAAPGVAQPLGGGAGVLPRQARPPRGGATATQPRGRGGGGGPASRTHLPHSRLCPPPLPAPARGLCPPQSRTHLLLEVRVLRAAVRLPHSVFGCGLNMERQKTPLKLQ